MAPVLNSLLEKRVLLRSSFKVLSTDTSFIKMLYLSLPLNRVDISLEVSLQLLITYSFEINQSKTGGKAPEQRLSCSGNL